MKDTKQQVRRDPLVPGLRAGEPIPIAATAGPIGPREPTGTDWRPIGTDAPRGDRTATGCNGRSLSELTDRELATAAQTALDALSPRARAFALALAGGQSATAAAQGVGLSSHPSPLSRLKRRVEGAVRFLREQARRASMLTLEVAVERFRILSEEARAAKDYSAATRALREACALLGLYPELRLKLDVQTPLTRVTAEEWEALAQLRHQVRKELPAAQAVVETTATPAGRADCHLPPSPAEETEAQPGATTGETPTCGGYAGADAGAATSPGGEARGLQRTAEPATSATKEAAQP